MTYAIDSIKKAFKMFESIDHFKKMHVIDQNILHCLRLLAAPLPLLSTCPYNRATQMSSQSEAECFAAKVITVKTKNQ